jgi:signal transduction histidine kinase
VTGRPRVPVVERLARVLPRRLDPVRVAELLPRPLDPVRSIKLKLGILVVSSGAAGLAVFYLGIGWLPPATSVTAILVALVTSQVLAHGMTRPLRDMTAAARGMARGDYSTRVRATSRDEVGELAGAFNQMAAELAEVDRQRRELVANVSHELRTPIAGLQAVLENLVDGVAEPDARTLGTALAQTERLGRLVAELLDLSRIDAGVQPLHPAAFDVADLLAAAVRESEVAAVAAGRHLRFELAAAPLVLVADRERLHQAVANLLDNACRHSPPDGTVGISAHRDGDQVVLEVTDEGPGIAPADRERVFQRFTRGARGGRDGGTGLGLAIARWVVQLHGGGICVLDPPGPARAGRPGCRMRVTLPAAPRPRTGREADKLVTPP